ncbi:hypothetical protein LINGRAHAP2_LOCUS993 [Linum grandiflorum]
MLWCRGCSKLNTSLAGIFYQLD